MLAQALGRRFITPSSRQYGIDAEPGLILWLLALAAICTALVAVVRSLPTHHRRLPKPERRCAKCNYRLAGLPSEVCPECGRNTTNDTIPPPRKKLLRRDRLESLTLLWFLITLCCVASLAYPERKVLPSALMMVVCIAPVLVLVRAALAPAPARKHLLRKPALAAVIITIAAAAGLVILPGEPDDPPLIALTCLCLGLSITAAGVHIISQGGWRHFVTETFNIGPHG